ncbi:MAG: hypothetical protein F6K40_07040 [Okeania sp. SIO3I5]|uniref:hypothetical protein n=1 Tax=Okeania sp. SIO3I5 TaxID=2607805 RepID=UPI0013BE0F75|nr:hypothetical protein [Okeania sp. SIO3I5]NEQ36052.1 hypothetical protein [Okeania sp. SIO3I5]
MIYKKLFELSIFHDYYTNDLCPDFILEPTIECRKILSGHRLIVRNKINGIIIIAPVDPENENQPQIELAKDLQFTFILKLKNQKIVNFTERDFQGSIFFNLQQKQLEDGLKCPSFSNKNIDTPGIVPLIEDKVILYYQDLPADGAEDKIKLSYEDLPGGQIVWGVIIIDNNDSLPVDFSQSSDYQITFERKEQHWRYYLITNDDKEEFLVKDNEGSISFSSFLDVTENDPIYDTLKEQFPSSKKYFSESTEKIPCQEKGIKSIQLLKSQSVWIQHLPNPPNDNIIQKAPKSEEMIQYQVINLLKNS